MATRPLSHPPPPFMAPMGGTIEERLIVIADAINRKADKGVQGPAFHFLGLISANGTTWRLTVDDAGALHTEAVPR